MQDKIFSILFFLTMSVYALLRELRDGIFISLVGFKFLPYAKIGSLFFLLFEIILYQKIVHKFGIIKSFSYLTIFYALFLFLYGCGIFWVLKLPQFLGYFFYFILEGYAPFIWNLLWSIFTFINNHNTSHRSLEVSFYAQIGAFISSFGMYLLIKNTFFSTERLLFFFILLLTSLFLFFTYFLINYIIKNKELSKKNEMVFDNQSDNFFQISWKSIQAIYSSLYVFALFLIVIFWEIINTLFQYIRLENLSEKASDSAIDLLANLYKSISITYFIGIILLFCGASIFVKKYGVKKTLFIFPAFVMFILCILYFFNEPYIFIFLYMTVRALYPALIFPIKESLYSITSKDIQFKSRFWIASFGSRISKTMTAYYMKTIFAYSLLKQRSINLIILLIITILFFLVASFLGNTYEKKIKEK